MGCGTPRGIERIPRGLLFPESFGPATPAEPSAPIMARRRLGFVAVSLVYLVALWLLWDTRILYPLKLFVVFLHELSHGLAAVLSGGSIQRIEISANQGGVCLCGGGNRFLTLSAGYLGSLLWGVGLLLVVGARKVWHMVALAALGVLVLAVSLLYIRSSFGLTFGLLFGLALIGIAKYLPAEIQTITLTLLGLTSCLYAVWDIKSDILDRPGVRSDASLLADVTGVPTVVWGLLWIGLAGAVCWWLLNRTVRRAR